MRSILCDRSPLRLARGIDFGNDETVVLTSYDCGRRCSRKLCTEPTRSTETYILVAANTRIPYWQSALDGLNRAATEMKVTVYMVGPKRYDPKAERDELLSAIQEKPSGILISAADATLLTADINSASQQGIPVITIDADAPASKRLFFIGSDNYRPGN